MDLLVCLKTGAGRRYLESIKNVKVEQNLHLIKKLFQKIMESIEGDARLTVCDIARKVGISLSTINLILE